MEICVFIGLLLIIQLLQSGRGTGAPDNAGTDFFLIYMDNHATSYSTDLELYVTTSRPTNVTVHVTSPLSTSPQVDQRFEVYSGYVHQLNITSGFRIVGSVKSNNAITVHSDDEVVVYAVNKEEYTNDAFLVLPLDVLGTEHFTVSFHPATYRTQFAVVATENCAVIIKLPDPATFLEVQFGGIAYYNGDTFTVNLSQYESLQIQSQGDLTGTYISSTKPVAVFSGNRRTRIDGYSSDHLVEQLPPVSTWGKTFALVPTPETAVGDVIKCVSSEASTTVNVSNYGSQVITKIGGHFQLVISSTDFITVTSDQPILVVQMVRSQEFAWSTETSDPSMTVIYPIEQYASDYTFTTPQSSTFGSYTNYFQIIIKDSDKSGLRLDNAALNSSTTWTQFSGTDYVGAHIPVSDGSHTIYHTSTIVTFGGFLYGYVLYESYSFPTGMRLAPVNTPCTISNNTVGDGLDNDCDGRIDEELCDGTNADNDGDESIDEDCARQLADVIAGTASGGSPMLPSSVAPSTIEIATTTLQMSPVWSTSESTLTTNNAAVPDATAAENSTLVQTATDSTSARSETWTSTNNPTTETIEGSLAETQRNNLCASGWFSCGADTGMCIEESFVCNCHSDCTDDSDESYNIAGCSYARIDLCNSKSGGFINIPPSGVLVVFLVPLSSMLGVWSSDNFYFA